MDGVLRFRTDYRLLDPVRASNGSRDPEAVLRQPTSVLLGVSALAAKGLNGIDIATVFDLATSELFNNAQNISLLAEDGEGSFALAPFLRALEDARYAGLVAVELSRHSHAGPDVAAKAIEVLRAASR